MGKELFEVFSVNKELRFKECINIIMNSIYFRKLADKTQVIISLTGPNVRTRLTHTIEVAKIARDMCHELGLNEDLAEAIALAHDIGHTPFGHVGERTLKEIMCGCNTFDDTINIKDNNYGFKHNLQSAIWVQEVFEGHKEFNKELNYIFWGVAAHSSMTWTRMGSGHDNEILIHCAHCEKVYNCDFKKAEKNSDSYSEKTKCKRNFKDYLKDNSDNNCSPWICSRIKNSGTPNDFKKYTRCATPCSFVNFWSYRSQNYTEYLHFKYLFDYPFLNYFYIPYFYNLLIKEETPVDFVSFEAVIVNIADEIAQRRQDFEDGIQQKLIHIQEGLKKLKVLILESKSLYVGIEDNELFKNEIKKISTSDQQLDLLSKQIQEHENYISANLRDINNGVTNSEAYVTTDNKLDEKEVLEIAKIHNEIRHKTQLIEKRLEKLELVDSNHILFRQNQTSQLGSTIVDFLKAVFLLKIKKVYLYEKEEGNKFEPNKLYESFFKFLIDKDSTRDFIRFNQWYGEFPFEDQKLEEIDRLNKVYFLKDYLDRLIKSDSNQANERIIELANNTFTKKLIPINSCKRLIKADLNINNLIKIQEIIDNNDIKQKLRSFLSNSVQSSSNDQNPKKLYFDDLNSLNLIKFLFLYKKLYKKEDWEKEGFNAFKRLFKANANQALMRFIVFDKREEFKEENKFRNELDLFEKFYKDLILKSESVEKNDGKSAYIIRRLFKGYLSNTHQLPDKALERIWKDIKPHFIPNVKKFDIVFEKIHKDIKDCIGKDRYPQDNLPEITFDNPEPEKGWGRYPKEISELGKVTKKLKDRFDKSLEELRVYEIRGILNNPILDASEDWKQVLYRGITNHIASLTDREALSEYEKLYFTTVELG
jgi:putative nucleotidyltransferase with HDIG domain